MTCGDSRIFRGVADERYVGQFQNQLNGTCCSILYHDQPIRSFNRDSNGRLLRFDDASLRRMRQASTLQNC